MYRNDKFHGIHVFRKSIQTKAYLRSMLNRRNRAHFLPFCLHELTFIDTTTTVICIGKRLSYGLSKLLEKCCFYQDDMEGIMLTLMCEMQFDIFLIDIFFY